MTAPADVVLAGSAAVDPVPLAVPRSWRRWIGPSISFAIIVAIARQFDGSRLAEAWRLVPRSPVFWLLFVLAYAALPISEFVIYRRLWRLPPSGFAALLRKLVGNELLLGYLGEVQFYAWARARLRLANAPFGTIKDVTLLSAVAGNLVTIAMLVVAWPLLANLHLGLEARTIGWSCAAVMLPSVAAMLFRQRLFSLPPADLRFTAAVHLVRIAAKLLLTALLWALALPGQPLAYWMLLSTLRQLLSRLPLLPNKDLAFVGIAVFLLGQDRTIADMLAMLGTATLAMHLLVGAALAAADLAPLPERAA